jgi:hypothetical protein
MRWRRRGRKDLNEAVVRNAEELVRKAEEKGVPEHRIAQALTDALDQSIPPFVDRLVHDTPRMLRNRRRVYRGFERRLWKRWGRALSLYRATLEAAVEAGTDFNERHRPGAVEENDYLFEALARLHARACLTGFEVFTLLRSGFPDAAYARWRTLHELAVVSNVLVEHGQDSDLAERFLLHEHAEHSWDALSYQKHAPALGYESFTDEEMQKLQRTREELVQRFGLPYVRPNGWAASLFSERPPTFAQLEELAEMAHMQPWYKLTSHKVHAGSKGLALTIGQRGPYRFLIAGPSNADLADPGHGALIALTQVTTSFLLRTRRDSIPNEPLRIVVSKALLQLTDMAGYAFLAAHKKLEEDEEKLWAGWSPTSDEAVEDDPESS